MTQVKSHIRQMKNGKKLLILSYCREYPSTCNDNKQKMTKEIKHKKNKLSMKISKQLWEAQGLVNKVTTSDLQGIIFTKAIDLLKDKRKNLVTRRDAIESAILSYVYGDLSLIKSRAKIKKILKGD